MTQEEFQTQAIRLLETFGRQSYSTDRMKMIWNAVRPYSADWFRRTCDEFIGSQRNPPLLTDFENAAVNERERVDLMDRARERAEREAMWNATAVPCPEEFKAAIAKILPNMPGLEDGK